MTEDDQMTLWVAATRYYLGRSSYAVHNFCALLRAEWHDLPAHTRMLMQREIDDAFRRDILQRQEDPVGVWSLGGDAERHAWGRVRALWDRSAGR